MIAISTWAIPRGNKVLANAHNASHCNQYSTSPPYFPHPDFRQLYYIIILFVWSQ